MDINDLETSLLKLESADQFSGVVLITQGEETLYEGSFGFASRSWKVKNTLDTRFDTASITKLFTAVSVLQLIERGDFTLDTKITDYLDIDLGNVSKEVTVSQLLTHSSGIGDDAEEDNGEKYADIWRERTNYLVTKTIDFLPQFIHKPANFAPGQGCRYCNCAYILLGLAIEKASGLDYRDYVVKNIFQRAGMSHSGFFRFDQSAEKVAVGADPVFNENKEIIGWQKNIYSFPPIGSPDAGAHVTAGELVVFLRAVQGNALLSSEMTEAFFTPRTQYREVDEGTREFGYGLWFALNKEREILCYQKEGVNAGVSAILRHYPGKDLTVVILSNMESGVWQPMEIIHKLN
ncbi:MAG: serine hydrolase [Planctomycetota bacterium]|nr:serine hydrolase [Planctomycetota bacterium]